jgi:diguanylate cyclase (GGDEF)-like protein
MIPVPIPINEAERLASLHRMQILSTPGEAAFDKVTYVAQHTFKTQMALISIIDEHKQWFKSAVGLDVRETPREMSFCGHVVYHGETMVIEDATQDTRFSDHPAVCAGPNIRFYAGRPLKNHEGFVIGTLCVVDTAPRIMTEEELRVLDYLGSWVESLFSARGLSVVVNNLLDDLDAAKRDSLIDPLLNIWNRRAIMDIMKREEEVASRQNTPMSVLMVDADDFKRINDEYGHDAGDLILLSIADTMRFALRSYDSIGRYGGEEFLVVLPHTGSEDGLKLAERLRAAVAAKQIMVGDEAIRCTVSIGIASADVGDVWQDKMSLVADADHALLKAKDLGKNRVERL